jgi:succinate-semialdehyde dehydrogenase/glutarate-semialdehyde dehydrogenase
MGIGPHLIEKALVNGRWIGVSEQSISVLNPATNETIGQIPHCDLASVDEAIDHAHRQWLIWKGCPPQQRCDVLRAWFELCVQQEDRLAQIITLEQGKPIAEALGEVRYGNSYLEWFAAEGKRCSGFSLPHPNPKNRIAVHKEPVGVVAAITPWNFPYGMITRKLGPAIATGCPVILKPDPQTPFSALALAELGLKAGLPAGAFQVIHGDADHLGKRLCSDRRVRKISFTGSTKVGSQLMAQCAPHIKRLSLELGGNAPFVVFEDADLEAACDGLMVAKFRNSGQTCVSANRIYVHEHVHEAFIKMLIPRLEKLKLGAGQDPSTTIGPLINGKACEKVDRHIRLALESGASCLLDGSQFPGNFRGPTLLKDVPHRSTFLDEETFGPVAPICSFSSEPEALEYANASHAGLVAYFYSENQRRCTRFAEQLDFGMVGINEGLISTAVAPFGGIKDSGMGREGSTVGLEDYLEMKYCCSSID